MTPREKADRAKQILEDPVFRAMFEEMRENIVSKLEQLPVSDVEAQHDLTITLQLLKMLKTKLLRYTEEILVDNAAARQQTWLKKARESIMP